MNTLAAQSHTFLLFAQATDNHWYGQAALLRHATSPHTNMRYGAGMRTPTKSFKATRSQGRSVHCAHQEAKKTNTYRTPALLLQRPVRTDLHHQLEARLNKLLCLLAHLSTLKLVHRLQTQHSDIPKVVNIVIHHVGCKTKLWELCTVRAAGRGRGTNAAASADPEWHGGHLSGNSSMIKTCMICQLRQPNNKPFGWLFYCRRPEASYVSSTALAHAARLCTYLCSDDVAVHLLSVCQHQFIIC